MSDDLDHALDRLEAEFSGGYQTWRRCSTAEHDELLRRWRAAYPGDVTGYARGKKGSRAQEELATQGGGRHFVVLLRDPSARGVGRRVAYEGVAERIPDLTWLSHYMDFFISPPDLAWTMIYEHEADEFGGPFFTRREWVIPEGSPKKSRRTGKRRGD